MCHGVTDRVVHGRSGSDGAGLPDSLGAERVDRGRRLGEARLVGRELGGGNERIVRQCRREWVALFVVDDLFEQRLRRALCDAAVDLSLGEQRVHDSTGIIDRDMSEQRDLARLGVHLDHREMGPEGEGGAR